MSKSQSFWKQHLKNCESSGLSQKDYCQAHGLNSGTFSAYKAKFKREVAVGSIKDQMNSSAPFISLKANETQKLTLKLSNDLTLSFEELPDPKWVGQLLEVVNAHSL